LDGEPDLLGDCVPGTGKLGDTEVRRAQRSRRKSDRAQLGGRVASGNKRGGRVSVVFELRWAGGGERGEMRKERREEKGERRGKEERKRKEERKGEGSQILKRKLKVIQVPYRVTLCRKLSFKCTP
jgi:hypothetical protein